MDNEKRNRIIAAVTVNVILLMAVLAAVVVYQIIKIQVEKNHRDYLIKRIEQLEKDTDSEKENLDYWQSPEGLEDLAYEFGFVYGR